MSRTRCSGIGPLFVLSACLLVGTSTLRSSADEAAPEVPRDQLGAATVEYQQNLLTKLAPDTDVSKVVSVFDAVIWNAFVPADNALSPERVALGRKLYFDKRLSKDGSVSCATCHDVTRGFTDQLAVSKGIGGQLGKRNAPTVLNTALLQTLFWDGRSPTLDHQARQPILNPVEMGMPDEATALQAISGDAEYQQAFKVAFGRDMNYEDLGPGDRGIRTDAGVHGFSLPALSRWGAGSDLGRGPGRVGSLQRQGSLRGLSPTQSIQSVGYRQSLS